MKHIILLLAMALFAAGQAQAQAIDSKAKTEAAKKASKQARSEAKKYKKDGWCVLPGALPLEKQLERSYSMQYETTDNGDAKYITGSSTNATGEYEDSRARALHNAEIEMAGKIQKDLFATVDRKVSSQQLGSEDAAILKSFIEESHSVVQGSISGYTIVTELYRVVDSKHKEVMVFIVCNKEKAMQQVVQKMYEDMCAKGDNNAERLKQLQ